MAAALCSIFFLSGAAGLLFQTLWFRQAGLVFGNSVWTSSLVLASFMGGLALGNGLAARRGDRLPRPLRVYAALEAAIAATGLGLVLLFPLLTGWLAPLLRSVAAQPWTLNGLRLGIGFVLLLVPATAMGATLPLLVTALFRVGTDFGRALGRLYGWNTLGAVAGALAGELVLIERLGVRGTGAFAAALDLVAAAAAFALASRVAITPAVPPAAAERAPLGARGRLLLLAAALCGGALLALEVVWFRFLQLFAIGNSLTFAIMLAVVLMGIALGGLLAAAWVGARPNAHRWLPELALGAGALTVLSYVRFDSALALYGADYASVPSLVLALSLWLMLPTCFASGVLFTLVGRALKDEMGLETATTGMLTLANTGGATAGALAAGFVLLPGLGVERSFFALSVAYGLVALALALSLREPASRRRGQRRVLAGAAAVYALFVALFPFGLMDRVYLARVARRFASEGSRQTAVREGLTETIQYLRQDLLGEAKSWRLVTNGFSMSGTGFYAERYMKLYVYWPVAVRPAMKSALVISFGVGSTAKALADTRALETIDVVDTSRDVLEMSRAVFPPGEHPLDDPRVRVHIEDGRFFLLTSDRRFDLITGDPPPPRNAGIVNLYSQEYFSLIRDRLAEGGLVTYWLPVFQLDLASTRSVLRGFCNVFPDCSLWTGAGLNWIMVGSRGGVAPVSEDDFTRQWRDPGVSPVVRALGFESPESLGALFVGDAAFARGFAGEAPPLVDDHPHRLSRRFPDMETLGLYAGAIEAEAARERFRASPLIRALWPEGLRERGLPLFEEQRIFNENYITTYGLRPRDKFPLLHEALTRTRAYVLPLLIMGSSPAEQAIVERAVARGMSAPAIDYLLGVQALALRNYREADRRFALTQEQEPGFERLDDFRELALCLAGEGEAASAVRERRRGRPRPAAEREFWAGLEAGCRPR